MPKAEKSVNGSRSIVTSVHINFTTDTELSPHGVYFGFHRQRGDEKKILFNNGSTASLLRLTRLIDMSPGRLITFPGCLVWKPYEPDYFRLDGARMRETIMAILQEGDWQLSDPDLDWSHQWDFAERVVEAMRFPDQAP